MLRGGHGGTGTAGTGGRAMTRRTGGEPESAHSTEAQDQAEPADLGLGSESATGAEAVEKLRLEQQLEAKLAKISSLIQARDRWKARAEAERSRASAEVARLKEEMVAERERSAEQARLLAATRDALASAEAKIKALIQRREALKQRERAAWAELKAERERLMGERVALETASKQSASTGAADGALRAPPDPDDVVAWVSFLAALPSEAVPPNRSTWAATGASPDGERVLDELTLLGAVAGEGVTGVGAPELRAWRCLAQFLAHESPGAETQDLHSLVRAAIRDEADASIWQALVTEALTQDRLELAAAASQLAALLNPANPVAHATRMSVLMHQRLPGLAAGHLMRAIELGGADPKQQGRALAAYHRLFERLWPGRDSQLPAIAAALASRGLRRDAVTALVAGASVSGSFQIRRALLAYCSGPPERSPPRRTMQGAGPLVLISQIQRSGGTLLTQLLDGHPELAVHPHELKIGHPRKWDWPRLDLSEQPTDLLVQLFEKLIPTFMLDGYRKSDGNRFAEGEAKPFLFDIDALCQTFQAKVKNAKSQRQVLDAYLSGFFAAWGDGEGENQRRWTVGFTPRVIMHADSIGRFFDDYPDGRVISCIRDPISWYASSRRHAEEYRDIGNAVELWKTSTRAAVQLASERPQQVHLLTYDSLVNDTEAAMRQVCAVLGIAFDPVLLSPTYRGEPVLPNSSFDISEYGVHSRSLDREEMLDAGEVDMLRASAMPIYEEAWGFIGATTARAGVQVG